MTKVPNTVKMICTSKLVYLALFLAMVQGVPARVSSGKADSEFGRQAEINEFKAFDALGEDEVFWYRALQSSLSMSMSMSMALEPTTESETPVDGATGESSGVSTGSGVSTSDAQQATPAVEEATPTSLQPVQSTVDNSQSSATQAVLGLSCVVGTMGLLFL